MGEAFIIGNFYMIFIIKSITTATHSFRPTAMTRRLAKKEAK